MKWRTDKRNVLLAGLLLFCSTTAWAHKQSDSYLTLQVQEGQVKGEWHLALRDLEDALGLDTDDDGAITWKELRSARPQLAGYATERLQIASSGQSGSLKMGELLVDHHSDGAYGVLRFQVEGLVNPSSLEICYRALFDIDPTHRGLLRLECGGTTRAALFGPESSCQRFELTGSQPRLARSPVAFIQEGIWHIWGGYDHLLFLIALLLPAALARRGNQWEPQTCSRRVFGEMMKTVTAFTVAHSITLTLAGLGWVHLPSRLVESAIAASVILAACNNLAPVLSGRAWPMAFGFGLIHGFGFANALSDLGLAHGTLAVALFGFNVGVEVGQLAVVGLVLPVIFGLRHQAFYRRQLMPIGSIAIGMMALLWLTERALDLQWRPF